MPLIDTYYRGSKYKKTQLGSYLTKRMPEAGFYAEAYQGYIWTVKINPEKPYLSKAIGLPDLAKEQGINTDNPNWREKTLNNLRKQGYDIIILRGGWAIILNPDIVIETHKTTCEEAREWLENNYKQCIKKHGKKTCTTIYNESKELIQKSIKNCLIR